MKRILSLVGMAVAMLFSVNSADAAITCGVDAFNFLAPAGGGSCSGQLNTTTPFNVDTQLNLSGAPGFVVNFKLTGDNLPPTVGFSELLFDVFFDDGFNTPLGSPVTNIPVNTSVARYLVSADGPYLIHVHGQALTSATTSFSVAVSASVVPIPGALLLFGSGLAALGLTGRAGRRSQKKAGATA